MKITIKITILITLLSNISVVLSTPSDKDTENGKIRLRTIDPENKEITNKLYPDIDKEDIRLTTRGVGKETRPGRLFSGSEKVQNKNEEDIRLTTRGEKEIKNIVPDVEEDDIRKPTLGKEPRKGGDIRLTTRGVGKEDREDRLFSGNNSDEGSKSILKPSEANPFKKKKLGYTFGRTTKDVTSDDSAKRF